MTGSQEQANQTKDGLQLYEKKKENQLLLHPLELMNKNTKEKIGLEQFLLTQNNYR